jgi:tetratricopeptide (TPR) repeat protein
MIFLNFSRQSTSGNRHPKADNRQSTFDIRSLSFCIFYLLSPISYLLSPICASAGASPADARLSLAASLYESGDFARSALEYRRLAADLDPSDKSLPGLYLVAADAYRAEGAWGRMEKMLDHAEDAGESGSAPLLLLRTEHAEGGKNWLSAADYAEELAAVDPRNERLAAWARGAAASDYLRAGDAEAARGAISGDSAREAALDRYFAGHDKSPRVGGLLGIVPGLGYAYSGEWGNMFRSIFLNGIFGWAMFECADREQWGLFAVSTFFEMTWYTGSIYGGIDAAHRYNRNRLDTAVHELRGDGVPRLERDTRLEVFSLRISF